MVRSSRYPRIIVNLLVALAISLVVNFSHLLLILTEQDEGPGPRRPAARTIDYPHEGVLRTMPDGHGYILFGSEAPIDSVYVPMPRIHRTDLTDGDRLRVRISAPKRRGSHYVMREVIMRNGKEFDDLQYNRQSRRGIELAAQILFYLLFSFVLLAIVTRGAARGGTSCRFLRRGLLCLGAAVALYFAAPVPRWPKGDIVPNFMNRHLLDYMLLLKCSFAFVVAMLYGRIYALIYQRQAIIVENERLKNENLATRYNMLVSQINPHFFFNSLNSLSMLVRGNESRKALTYIDQLSYTFRYILQNGQNTLTTLADELKFTEAYIYLFRIRFADKLFFDIEIDPQYQEWLLPVLSLQPLLDNAVKHNMITRSRPLRVSIRTEAGWLVVENPKRPKPETVRGTGIGLENLSNRWLLITGRQIEVIDAEGTFTVRLPLQKHVAQ